MVTYSTPSSRYLPKPLVKLIKTSAAIGLKSVIYEEGYNEIQIPSIPAGVPKGTLCTASRDDVRNVIVWEARWP